jgi:cytochrome c oxidase assembly factor CtaG/putative copper export protein
MSRTLGGAPQVAGEPTAVAGRIRSRSVSAGIAALPTVGILAVVAGLAVTGAALPTALLDSGPVVRWGLPIVATLREIAGALTLGALVLAIGVLPRRVETAVRGGHPERPERHGRSPVDGRAYPASLRVAGIAGTVWAVLCVLHLVLTYADVAGTPVDSAGFGDELGLFSTQIALGRTLLAVTVIAAVTGTLALLVTTPTGAAWTAAVATSALALQAVTGHSATTSGNHELAISSLFLHLLSAAVWIGALAALAVLVGRLGADLGSAVGRYSTIAGWCFAGVAISGVVNAMIRIGGWDGLTTRYGYLVLAKIAIFGVLGVLGVMHRRAVIPGLDAARSGAAGSAIGARAARLFWRLVAVELAVMGAVSGVAVALAASPPPVAQVAVPNPTPAEIVTGHLLPPELTGARWFTEWSWDVLLTCAAAAGLVVYLRWVRRLRARGDAWPRGRTACWVAGMVIFVWTTSGGPGAYGHVLFSAHMVEHMILVMVIPILLVLAAPVTLALRALPSRQDDSRGPREWILGLVNSRVARFMSNPIVAGVNFAGSLTVFYYSNLFGYALSTYIGHVAMVVHFSLAGYLFVNTLVGIDPGPNRWDYPQRFLVLFATMTFHAFFGVALMSSQVLLAPEWFGVLGRPWGLSAIADQQLGGGIAWGIGELPTLALAVAVAFSWSRTDERIARRRDSRVDREGDIEMDEYNAMLKRIADRDTEK